MGLRPEWYLLTDITPCFKYFIFQDSLSNQHEAIGLANDEFYESRTAKWIAVNANVNLQRVENILHESYHEYNRTHIDDGDYDLVLYQRNF